MGFGGMKGGIAGGPMAGRAMTAPEPPTAKKVSKKATKMKRKAHGGSNKEIAMALSGRKC